jgi:hypothetical protein
MSRGIIDRNKGVGHAVFPSSELSDLDGQVVQFFSMYDTMILRDFLRPTVIFVLDAENQCSFSIH